MNLTNKELLKQIGNRLIEERCRLKLKPENIYSDDLVSLHRATYEAYETGKREIPGTLLYRLWHMGFDIQYIITGQCSED